jgi:hypothetical protein
MTQTSKCAWLKSYPLLQTGDNLLCGFATFTCLIMIISWLGLHKQRLSGNFNDWLTSHLLFILTYYDYTTYIYIYILSGKCHKCNLNSPGVIIFVLIIYIFFFILFIFIYLFIYYQHLPTKLNLIRIYTMPITLPPRYSVANLGSCPHACNGAVNIIQVESRGKSHGKMGMDVVFTKKCILQLT